MCIKNQFHLYNFILGVVLSFGVFFTASSVSAATITFRPQTGSYVVGDTLNVKIVVDSSGKSINAVSAIVKYPSDMLSLASISKSGSIINLWAQEPSYSNANGTASLEGIILNGYTGSSGNIATLIFKVKNIGSATLSYQTASVLANDGTGTDILSNKQVSAFTIIGTTSQTKTAPLTNKKPAKNTTIAISEIKNTDTSDTKKSFLITSPQMVKDNIYTIDIDLLDTITFIDDGSHVFTAPILNNGAHDIKVVATDTAGDDLIGNLKFSTQSLKVPTITYYPSTMYVDQFMVLKGIADPLVDIELTITNTNTTAVSIEHIQTNSDGKFTYVPDEKMVAGTYSIIGRASNKDGVTSDFTPSIQVINKEHEFNSFVSRASGYLALLTPLVALLALIILALMYSFYHVKRAGVFISKKLSSTEDIIEKSFGILGEDVDEEINIFRKIKANKPLTKDEQTFLSKFKKDIDEAEKIIEHQVKQMKK